MTHWLYDRLRSRGNAEAIVCGATRMSYRSLSDRIDDWRHVFAAKGLCNGAVVAIHGGYSADACALFLALATTGRVAAPLPAGEKPEHCLGLAAAEAAVTLASDGEWSWSALPAVRTPPLLQRLRDRNAGGVIVFTSGSTGQSKAGLFDFDTLTSRYRTTRHGWRTLAFLTLDHLGGIHTMMHTLAYGGTLVVAQDRSPEAVCRAIERERIELLPTTPTFLRMLTISDLHRRCDLSSLRLITYGTEPMPAATLRSLMTIFPEVRFKQTYGLSELGVLPTRSRTPDSLWLEIGCDTRVVDGELWIRSRTAMLGYLNLPSPFDAEGWYNTGDMVEVDGSFVRVLGRKGERINVAGQKVFPAEIEDVLLELENVVDVTVWGQPNAVTGQVVAARVSLAEPEEVAAFECRFYAFCRDRLAPYKIPVTVDIVAGEQHGARFKKARPR